MNLITDPWIQVRYRSDEVRRIAPIGLLEGYRTDPVQEVLAPRADMRQSLYVFLIGLLQSSLAPASESQWRPLLEGEVPEQELPRALQKLAPYFELEGQSAFMQDYEELEGQDSWPIEWLFMDGPGQNTLKLNTDHFVKRGRYEGLCPGCTSAIMYCLQSSAPGGGRGYHTSIRGGGPISCILVPEDIASHEWTLWNVLWANVLPVDVMNGVCGNPALTDASHTFLWTGKTPTSENGRTTTPQQCHPNHVYWGMPRRIRLEPPEQLSKACSLCEKQTDRLYSRFRKKWYGIDYKGEWRHPLTAYTIKDQVGNPQKGQPEGFTYKYWGRHCLSGHESFIPPIVVEHYHLHRHAQFSARQVRLWVGGYDMKDDKARCWYEAVMPLFEQPQSEQDRESLATMVLALTGHAEKAAYEVSKKIKDAGAGGSSAVRQSFWQQTESAFYVAVGTLSELACQGKLAGDAAFEAVDPVYDKLRQSFRGAALQIFDRQVLSQGQEQLDMRQVVKARRALASAISKLVKL